MAKIIRAVADQEDIVSPAYGFAQGEARDDGRQRGVKEFLKHGEPLVPIAALRKDYRHFAILTARKQAGPGSSQGAGT